MTLFINDYSEGCHERILDALTRTNREQTTGYGTDPYCEEARAILHREMNCPTADIWFLSGGTQTNLIAMTAALRPHEAVIGAASCHIFTHETGAIEATGHKVIAVPGADGKLTPAAIADAAAQHCAAPGVYDEHMVLPRMAYISDATELGTVYTKAELTALRAACDAHGMYLYLDGARLAQALTAAGNDLQPEDLPRLCDAFYIGGTKNGLLFGEAMVIVNDALRPGFRRAMKRNGAMLAKGRLLGVQFAAAMAHDLWLDMGRHADAQAQRIAAALTDRNVPMPQCGDHQKRKPERTCRHLLQSRRRTLWHESVAGRHRNKQAQLHPFSGSCRPLAGGRDTPPSAPGDQQSKHGIHTAPHGREPLTSTVHPFILQHQPDQDTVAAHHRTGMGIPILRRRCFRQPTEI